MKIKILAVLLLFTWLLTACKNWGNRPGGEPPMDNEGFGNITSDESSYGDNLQSLGAMDGYFEGTQNDIEVRCIAGTSGCYRLDGNVLTFTAVSSESLYSISGRFSGSIVIDVGEANKFELELSGLSLISDSASPITILSGDEVTIQAKKNTKNYIYDIRPAVSEDDNTAHSGAIHSEVDMEISGKGSLWLVSQSNNGIHSKNDLQVKNLSLTVSCKDNALKGNDSVTLENATATLIASMGDCVKTTRTDISAKGNQRGIISFLGGSYNLFAAGDGIDAAYNVTVSESTNLNIYTDKYSNYSEQHTSAVDGNYYLRATSQGYTYSIRYYNSDTDTVWVNAEYHSYASGGRNNYYFYTFPKNDSYSKMQIFVYSDGMAQGQAENYYVASDLIACGDAFDTVALNIRGGRLSYDMTNFRMTRPGDGNTEKSSYSTKGIKAANEVIFYGGNVNIKSYDDAIHVSNDTILENGEYPKGSLAVNGGNITVYSKDDGLHADGSLVVNGGNLSIINSYEGIEGETVAILGGNVSIISRDDGINATLSSGTTITVGGGELYIYCGGDCIDSNSRTSYAGIEFSGGKSLLVTTSGGNSAIDSESGYKYVSGIVVAVMRDGGMSNESTRCQNFASIGRSCTLSLEKGSYLECKIGSNSLSYNLPTSLFARVVLLGDGGATATTSANDSTTLSEGAYAWN